MTIRSTYEPDHIARGEESWRLHIERDYENDEVTFVIDPHPLSGVTEPVSLVVPLDQARRLVKVAGLR